MKRILKFIICLLFLSVSNVYAASFNMNLSANNTSVNVGEEVNIYISLNNIEGIPNGLNVCQATLTSSNITINSIIGNGWNITNGNVIIMDSANSVTNNATIATIKAKVSSAGNITISNIVCSDGENEYSAGSKTVKFSIKENTTTKTTTTTTQPIREEIKTTTTKTTTQPTTSKQEKSTYLTNLKIENFEINFDKNIYEYSITVDNSQENININYELEDPTSKVTINKSDTLIVGENKIEVVVTNDNVETRTYIINVIKEKALSTIEFTEEKILQALEQNNKNINVKVDIKDNKILSKTVVKKIIESKKNINFTVYDKNLKIYTFKIDGNKIKNIKDIDFNINLTSDYKPKIDNILKNKKNIQLSFNTNNLLPEGNEIILHNINFKNKAYLYYYNQNKNTLEDIGNFKVENNEIILDLEYGANYVLLNQRINNISIILISIMIIIIITLIITAIVITKKNKKNSYKNI